MQPILTIVTSAFAFVSTVWVVSRMLRSVFPKASQNSLGVVLIAAAIWMLFFRLFAVSLVLFILGAAMLATQKTAKPRGAQTQQSRVRSAHLEMTLDHDSGDIDGRILCGPHEGRILSELSLSDLLKLLSEIQVDDQSLKLLETYLDRAHPDWHDHAARSAQDHGTPSPHASDMSREEAYRILGLEPGATEAEIRGAYHRLIKRLHPDRGGSAVLTAQITAARDRLLGEL
ncbi:MAG: DnaJ domain-containing protein [Roseobacter sp.]|jgi:DnaJ-domain-containing protein 1